MDLFALTRALIDIDSVTGRERAVAERIEAEIRPLCERHGGRIERMPVAEERFNLFAAWGVPRVVLSTHMDTVPPFFPSTEDGEAIRGRGACDTKGAIAAMLAATGRLLDEGRRDFGLLFVVGEETDSVGAQAAERLPRGARYLINGEPTENRLALGTKGALYLAIEAVGQTAHSAYPELGDSAIEKLLAALAALHGVALPTDPVLGETTLNVGTIAGGRAANVVPDRARAEVMLRTVGPTAELRAALARSIEGAGAAIAEVRETRAMRLGSLPGFETVVVRYTTDIPRLPSWGEPFLLGPGSIRHAHTADEHVRKTELRQAVELYARLVRELSDRGSSNQESSSDV
jgi:acetylornithine deacetylase